MTITKAIKKTFVILLSVLVTLLISSVVSTFIFKDELINHFIREANKQLSTPINIGKISVSALDNFPRMTLNFEDVYIEESFKNSSYPLLEAASVQFTFNPLEIYRGNYTVEQIHVTDASCHFKMSKEGVPNYIIFKKPDTTQNQKVKLDLSQVTLQNIDFKYSNFRNEVFLDVNARTTTANVGILNKTYEVTASGDYWLKKLLSSNTVLMENKEVQVETSLTYNDLSKHVDFKQSLLKIKGSDFITYGSYDFLQTPTVEFYVEGKDTNLQTLVSLLPDEKIKPLSKYESKGDVYFDLILKGAIGDEASPSLQINFGLIDTELSYPDKNLTISKANASGQFAAENIKELSRGSLNLNDISGELEGKKFTGDLLLRDFKDLFLKLDFDGVLDVHSLLSFLDQNQIENAEGEMVINLNMEGKVNNLKKKETAYKVKTSGEIDLRSVSFRHSALGLPMEKINGNLLFNNNDLAISDVSGFYGTSDFMLNGFFKNIIAYVLFENEPIGIEADLKSRFINLDELLSQQQSESDEGDYSFSISPRLMLKFNCDVDALKFRRFKPQSINGNLKIKNQVAFTDNLQFNSMGGQITLSGLVDATDTTAIHVNSDFSVNRVNIDSIFYVFENFNQSFLQDKHLKGQILADVQAEMTFDHQLNLKAESLTSTINTSIIGGELNNFEPMQKLAKYVDEEKLDHLTFSDLRNEIHVENKTIYLPQMEVSSNVTDIKISGTHTFDQRIDYRVIAPLRSKERIDPDEAFGAIEENVQGKSMLYLKIIGTTSDYKIVFDKEGVKKKIVSDLKKEVDELKNAFKNKGLDKKKTIELEEDDYFDWDDDGN